MADSWKLHEVEVTFTQTNLQLEAAKITPTPFVWFDSFLEIVNYVGLSALPTDGQKRISWFSPVDSTSFNTHLRVQTCFSWHVLGGTKFWT